jgi:uncharacterized protein YegL
MTNVPLRLLRSLLKGTPLSTPASPPHGSGASDGFPVALAQDTSPSTFAGQASELIRQGAERCYQQIANDALLAKQIDFAWYGFGRNTTTERYADFRPAKGSTPPEVPVVAHTCIYELYIRMVQELHERVTFLREECDRDVTAAWAIYFSDFQVTDASCVKEALEAKAFAETQGINLFMIGCGTLVDEAVIQSLSQKDRPPVFMSSKLDFKQFFAWLYGSLRAKSQSQPGQSVQLPPLFGKDLLS